MMSRLFISFSGGRTSAYMTHQLLREKVYDEVVVLFANTGQEHEKTLQYINQCDTQLGFGTVWMEAITNPTKGMGQKARVVDFATAARRGEPYEEAIKKHGIPNTNSPWCTKELKTRPMQSYIREVLGWAPRTYDTAIGIRADEMDRVNPRYKEERIIYPLVDKGISKGDVITFWSRMPFDLDIPEHLGNCVWCWKKSLRKLLTLAKECPEVFEFPQAMEAKYPDAGPGGEKDRPRMFFRERRTVADLVQMARNNFNEFREAPMNYTLDLGGSCSDSCEIMGEDE